MFNINPHEEMIRTMNPNIYRTDVPYIKRPNFNRTEKEIGRGILDNKYKEYESREDLEPSINKELNRYNKILKPVNEKEILNDAREIAYKKPSKKLLAEKAIANEQANIKVKNLNKGSIIQSQLISELFKNAIINQKKGVEESQELLQKFAKLKKSHDNE